jgi:hypothetical protein
MNTATHVRKQLSGTGGTTQSLGATRAALRRHLWIWPVLAALLLGGVGWWIHHSVEVAMREELAGQLTTILNADVEALRTWTRDQEANARSLAMLPALRPAVHDLVALADRPDDLPQAPALANARALLNPFVDNYGYVDFFVVSPSMRIVADKNGALLKSTLEGDHQAFAKKALSGTAAVSRPSRSIALLPDAKGELKPGQPTMFVAAPVRDEAGKPFAVLAFRVRPEKEFSEILRTARFGYSGETYAFSETGLLLSQSRFDDNLKRLGLLPDVADAQSILTVEVRDPGVNMMEGGRPSQGRAEQPLTKLASKAVSDGGGVVMEPYGDYRGVPSVGACQWLPEQGFGVATEVDVADAV